jgi:hypothetical protein
MQQHSDGLVGDRASSNCLSTPAKAEFMVQMIRCKHCQRLVPANPRVKDQLYCGRKKCQRARKSDWHRQKMKSDPDYAESQDQARQKWSNKNRNYWSNYRDTHPEYTKRNRRLQKQRDLKRRQRRAKMDASDSGACEMDASGGIFSTNTVGYATPVRDLAKMDTSEGINPVKTGSYRIHPKKCHLAKMDASKEIYILIPISSENLAKMDKIDIHIEQGPKSGLNHSTKEVNDDNRKEAD